ncbi:SIS domain-containing protein [Aerococcus urinae]|uniref:SIS domain-containing protein n=1 Tax=Aerococcus TaxID=1375 RepID=UPI0018A7E136|nr:MULTISPECIES: SIS domain-containing protein [Aerococcus]MCY3036273.1 SIS domain-containing protein [Aerococcus sp. Group 2]MDK6520287.1 SIS domain-containing protein [Aerococcus urinae]
MLKYLNSFFDEYKEALDSVEREKVNNLYKLLKYARSNNKNIFIMGNGGSASNAGHWVCDFNKGSSYKNSLRFRMIALSDNLATCSAIANDFDYRYVFSEQLKNLFNEGDIVIGLSVSGNSENIVEGLKYAKSHYGKTFSLIGGYNGKMKDYSDDYLVISSKNYGIVEDIHMNIGHLLSQYFKIENENEIDE